MSNWRAVQTLDDCLLFSDILEQADNDLWYRVSRNKGQREHDANFMLTNQVPREDYSQAIYEDGDKKCAFQYSVEGSIGRIRSAVGIGFDQDLFTNCRGAVAVLAEKIRSEMDTKKINRFYSISPRTKYGECMAYWADLLLKEATVTILNDISWKLDFDRSQKAIDETDFTKIRKQKTDVNPDLKPINFNPNVSRSV